MNYILLFFNSIFLSIIFIAIWFGNFNFQNGGFIKNTLLLFILLIINTIFLSSSCVDLISKRRSYILHSILGFVSFILTFVFLLGELSVLNADKNFLLIVLGLTGIYNFKESLGLFIERVNLFKKNS